MQDSIFFRRHSKRSYLGKLVPKGALERIFEKIRWTPSCSNNQPWRFVFVQERNRHAELAPALAKGNEWAAKAPILVAVCGRRRDDYVRKDDSIEYYQFDIGMATMSLLLAAVEEGLMAHPMAGYKAPEVKKALDIPGDCDVLCLVALGYEGSIDLLDNETRAKDESPRTRKEVGEMIAIDRFAF